jgi:PAS domain S-box-containing protein
MYEKEFILDDNSFLVSATDEKGIIKFANNDFCKIANYKLDELIGQPHNIVRHPDMPKSAFEEMWKVLKSGNVWTGYVKNSVKNGGYYWFYATCYPFVDSDGQKGYLSCRRKPNREEIEFAESTLLKGL